MKPNEGQIAQTIADIQQKPQQSQVKKPINRAIREGYTEVVNILVEGRETYDGVDALTTVQGRAIAVLGVDYLNGECELKELMGATKRIGNDYF